MPEVLLYAYSDILHLMNRKENFPLALTQSLMAIYSCFIVQYIFYRLESYVAVAGAAHPKLQSIKAEKL